MKQFVYICLLILLFVGNSAAQTKTGNPPSNVEERSNEGNFNSNGITNSNTIELKKKPVILKKEKMKSAPEISSPSVPISTNQIQQISGGLKKEYDQKRQKSFSATSRTIDVSNQKELDGYVNKMGNVSKSSFEYNLTVYVNGNYDVANFSNLEKAYNLNPNNEQVLKLMSAHYEITRDKSKKKAICSKLKEVKAYSSTTYEYAKNVLNSIPVNAVLVTHGSLDTYPLFVLSEVDKVRPDVKIVSLDLMQSEAYRTKLKNDGFQLPSDNIINKVYLKKFCELNESKNVYLSLTIPKEYFTDIKSNIFATGLAFRYSSQKTDNMKELESNWNKFDKQIFEQETKPSNEAKKLYGNYLIPLILLKKHYIGKQNFKKSEELGAYIHKISEWKNNTKKVEQIMSK